MRVNATCRGAMARGPREVRTGYPEERALRGHLRGGREERAGGAEETACTKAGKLERVRQVGIPVNNCVPGASASRELDRSRSKGGSEGRALARRGFCALQKSLQVDF